MVDGDKGLEEIRDALLDQNVVVDVRGPLVYLGMLVEVGKAFLILAEADVHDITPQGTPKERYILEAGKHGIKTNRSRVMIKYDEIVSISALDDIIDY